MTSPKHLWSGDWREESASAAAQRARRAQGEPPPDEHTVHEPPTPAGPPPADRSFGAGARERVQAAVTALRPRYGLLLTAAALLLVAVAVALTNTGGDPNPATRPGLSFQQPGFGSPQVNPSTPQSTATQPAWIGLQMVLWPTGGAEVQQVAPNSPAAAAGLQTGDIITGIDNDPVQNPSDVTQVVSMHQPGDQLPLDIVRGASAATLQVTLASRPAGAATP